MINKYLQLDELLFTICILVMSVFLIYIQQEYVLIPQMHDSSLVGNVIKEQVIDGFNKYRWLSFLLNPAIVLLRITFVSGCLFVGVFLFDDYKKMSYKACFNIALKSDIILIIFSIIYTICVVLYGADFGLKIIGNVSLLFLFNLDNIDYWMTIPISAFNLFELIYWLFIALLLSILNNKTIIDSLNFVISTYGVGFILYVLFITFASLCMFQ